MSTTVLGFDIGRREERRCEDEQRSGWRVAETWRAEGEAGGGGVDACKDALRAAQRHQHKRSSPTIGPHHHLQPSSSLLPFHLRRLSTTTPILLVCNYISVFTLSDARFPSACLSRTPPLLSPRPRAGRPASRAPASSLHNPFSRRPPHHHIASLLRH